MIDEENNTVIDEETVDNSIDDISEPDEDSDNSDISNNEPADNGKKPTFATYEEALKGYENLHKKFGEQSSELGELRKRVEQLSTAEEKQAKENGFESVEDYRNYQLDKQDEKVLAECIADEYLGYLDQCDFPEQVRRLLEDYKENPSDELLDEIEDEFPRSVVKKIAVTSDVIKGQLQDKRQETLNEQVRNSARAYLQPVLDKYNEDFKNPAFASLYGEAFRAYGEDLHSEKFINMLHAYRDSILSQNNINAGIKEDNDSATDEIAGLSFSDNSPSGSGGKSLTDMTPDELNNYVRQHI